MDATLFKSGGWFLLALLSLAVALGAADAAFAVHAVIVALAAGLLAVVTVMRGD